MNNLVNLDVENFDFKNFCIVMIFLSVILKICLSLPCLSNNLMYNKYSTR